MTPSPVPGAAVTQFAVIDALLAGAYESGLRIAEARSIGDFGLGCVDHLGGEVLIVDGEAIECTLDVRRWRWTTTTSSRSRSCADFLTSRESAWASRTSRASRHPSRLR
jgi:alpha-acetolactate decarboxylase